MPRRGGVQDRQVVAGRSCTTLELGEIPYLADRHQFGEPGRRRGEQLEEAAAAEDPRQRVGTSCRRSHSAFALSGSIEMSAKPAAIRRSPPAAGDTPKRDGRRACPLSSHRITCLPCRAASKPNAAATVVLPTPPLPVTTTSRLFRSDIKVAPA